jgi:Flp pilus assembly protein TadD
MPISEEEDKAYWDAASEATELLHEERFHEALTALRELIVKTPQNPYAYHFLGVALYEVGELEPARDAYRAALRLSPTYLGSRVALSHVLRQLGDPKEAIKEGSIALTQSPNDPDALHAVGLAYLERGDDKAARKYLEAFLATRPEFEVAVEVRAIVAQLAARDASN